MNASQQAVGCPGLEPGNAFLTPSSFPAGEGYPAAPLTTLAYRFHINQNNQLAIPINEKNMSCMAAYLPVSLCIYVGLVLLRITPHADYGIDQVSN